MRKVLIFTLILALITVGLTGCSTSSGFVDDQLRPMLENGVYINSFDTLLESEDSNIFSNHLIAQISVYPVSEEKQPVRELTKIIVGRDTFGAMCAPKGEGYSIQVSKLFVDETIKEPKMNLDYSKDIKPEFWTKFLSNSNAEGRNAIEHYAVKLYLPKGYSIPDKFKTLLVPINS